MRRFFQRLQNETAAVFVRQTEQIHRLLVHAKRIHRAHLAQHFFHNLLHRDLGQNILVVLRLHERDRIRRICEREIQQFHLLRRIFLRDFSLHQLGEKLLPQQRQALLVYFFLPLPVGAEIVFFF